MFSLVEKPENTVFIDGEEYTVDTSFDNIIVLREWLDEASVSEQEKVEGALRILLKTKLPCSINEKVTALNELIEKFVTESGEHEELLDLEGNPMPVQKKQAPYSFKYDAQYIYAAFMDAYSMDLHEMQGKLDWATFKALLNSLPSDTKFSEIVHIRTKPYPKGKGTEKERSKLRQLKKQLSFPGSDFSKGGEY